MPTPPARSQLTPPQHSAHSICCHIARHDSIVDCRAPWYSTQAAYARHIAKMAVGVSAERHPFALLFHWLWKIMAYVYFFICGWVGNFIVNFVVLVVLLALDFWTVKNVTGRKLVGLRWWNEANDSGSAWRFEQAPEGSRIIHPSEKRLFWIGLVVNLAWWAFFTVIEIFRVKIEFVVICIIGVIMASSNLVGYFKCSREAGDQLKAVTSNLMQRAATQAVTNAMSNRV